MRRAFELRTWSHTYARWTVFLLPLMSVGCSLISGPEDIVRLDMRRRPAAAKHLTARAATYLQEDDFVEAERLIRKALEADPQSAAAHNNMGLVHFAQNDLFHAAIEFEQASQCDPSAPAPHNNLGLTFESAGRMSSAIEHYQVAHGMAPTNPEYLGNLIRARLRAGDPPEALRPQLQELKFIERRPDWIEWIDEQLELVTNPWLDRGPETPDLPQFDSGTNDVIDEDRVIYDSGAVSPTDVPPSPEVPADPESSAPGSDDLPETSWRSPRGRN